MISDHPLLLPVRYVIAITSYNIYKARYKGDNRIEPWLRKLCEELSFDYDVSWPDVAAVDNPMLCEFCGTQLGTHYASAVVRKGYNFDTCCKQLKYGERQSELFWYNSRLKIECAIHTYMNVPRIIVQHCMALELMEYMRNKKDFYAEQQRISSIDGNGFEQLSCLTT